MLIVNGVVHTMENGVIPNGFVLVQGSRIGPVSYTHLTLPTKA